MALPKPEESKAKKKLKGRIGNWREVFSEVAKACALSKDKQQVCMKTILPKIHDKMVAELGYKTTEEIMKELGL